jgi:outer membrane lipoprotein-sorting protein
MRSLLAVAFCAGLSVCSAHAAPDADVLLKKAFDNYRANSSTGTVSMTIHRPDWERSMTFRSWTRGEDDALVRFLAPAKDAGNATLKSVQGTWVFNPKLNQVIKLPASMMAQSWMGSDFSYNDLAKSTELMDDYTHKLTATGIVGGHTVWTVECMPKPGAAVVWGKVVLKLRDDDVVVEQTYYDQDGKPARRMTADKVGDIAGRPYPLVMTMHPLDTPDSWTRIETTAATFNIAVPDYLFTLSSLQNPRE